MSHPGLSGTSVGTHPTYLSCFIPHDAAGASHAAAHAATIKNNSAPRFLTAIAVINWVAELR